MGADGLIKYTCHDKLKYTRVRIKWLLTVASLSLLPKLEERK